MVSLVRSIISLASDFGLPANFEDCYYIDGLVQKRRDSIANALELHLSCIKPLIYEIIVFTTQEMLHLYLQASSSEKNPSQTSVCTHERPAAEEMFEWSWSIDSWRSTGELNYGLILSLLSNLL